MTASSLKESDFIKAYEAYADAIFRHCYYRVFERERARELMQETFMRAWAYIAHGEEVKNLRAFLYKVANNLVIDESRRRKEASLEKMQEEGFEASHDGRDEEHGRIEGRELMGLLKELDETYREVLIMRYVDDLNPREIAEALGVSANVVSVRLNRGIKKLRALAIKNGKG